VNLRVAELLRSLLLHSFLAGPRFLDLEFWRSGLAVTCLRLPLFDERSRWIDFDPVHNIWSHLRLKHHEVFYRYTKVRQYSLRLATNVYDSISTSPSLKSTSYIHHNAFITPLHNSLPPPPHPRPINLPQTRPLPRNREQPSRRRRHLALRPQQPNMVLQLRRLAL
jgi:hypothetical protein